MKKIMALGAVGVLSLAMGTSAFAAGSAGRFANRMIGHYVHHASPTVYIREYCDNYVLADKAGQSIETCVSVCPGGYSISDQVSQREVVCVQGCPGGYTDANGNGICDNCENAGYHGTCDNFVDADGNGVCDNLHHGNGYGGGYGNGGGSGSGSGYGNGGGSGYGNGGGHHGGHHGGHGGGCRR